MPVTLVLSNLKTGSSKPRPVTPPNLGAATDFLATRIDLRWMDVVAKAPAAAAPVFTATPSIHQLGDGSVEFEVRLTSCPAPSVQWYKGSTAISDGGRYRAVTHTDGVNYILTLTISGVTKDDGGAYKVTAKTAAGESNANINLNLEGSFVILTDSD